jgi:hypothetical protein
MVRSSTPASSMKVAQACLRSWKRVRCRFFASEDLHEAWDCPSRLRYPLGMRNFTIPDWAENGIDTAPVQAALDPAACCWAPRPRRSS